MLKIYNKNILNKLLWLLIIIIMIVLHINDTMNNDEAVILEGALNIFHHKEIYKDFFEFTSPGVFYLLAWTWQIFGVSYWSAKALSILALIASLLGVYKISENISKKSLNVLGPLLLILNSAVWPIVMYHTFNLVFMIWAVFYILKGLDQQKNKYFIISGLLTALSIIFMQNKGLLLMGALGSFLLLLSIKNKAYWPKVIIYGSSVILPITLLFFKWSPVFLYQHLIEFPLKHYPGLQGLSYGLLILFILWSLLITIILFKEKNKKIYLLMYVQIILLLSNTPLPNFFHLGLTLFPSYALIGLSISKIKEKGLYSKIILSSLMSIGVLFTVMPSISWPKYVVPFANDKKNNALLQYINENCNQSPYIYAGPFLPTIYFNTNFKNPTSFSWFMTGQHTAEQFLLASQQLDNNRSDCAILDYQFSQMFKYDWNNPLDNYIKANYHHIKTINDVSIYKRNALPTSTNQ